MGSIKEENMKQIPLTQGQFAIVDDDEFERLSEFNWKALWNKDIRGYYAAREIGGRKNKKTIYMHRLIANTPVGMVCDHIHHNTLDNRKSELRNLSPAQSNMNMRLRKDNKLGIRGIHKKECGSYMTRLVFNGEIVLCKTVKTLEEALNLRKKAEDKYFGEFSFKE